LLQFYVYADDANILSETIRSIMKNEEAFVAATTETGLEVNAEKTKCMVMS
jgi:hypothetical protein